MRCHYCHEEIQSVWVRFESATLHPECQKDILRLRKFYSIPKRPAYYLKRVKNGPSTIASNQEFIRVINLLNHD